MINNELIIYYSIGFILIIILFLFIFKRKKTIIKEDTIKEITVPFSSLNHKSVSHKGRSILAKSSNIPVINESNINEIVKWTESTSYYEDPKKMFTHNNIDNMRVVSTNEPNKYKLNVLLVDDSLVVRKYISDLLQEQDYNVITKNDGSEGLEYLNTSLFKPDLIISDIEMPVMDGFTFINKLREDDYNIDIPILVISAHAESHFSLMSEGKIQGFIKKPFSNEDLLKQIDYLLGV